MRVQVQAKNSIEDNNKIKESQERERERGKQMYVANKQTVIFYTKEWIFPLEKGKKKEEQV